MDIERAKHLDAADHPARALSRLGARPGPSVGHLALALDGESLRFVQLLVAARRALRSGAESFLAVDTEECLVVGSLSALSDGLANAALVVVPRVLGELPDDDLTPNSAELVASGPHMTSVFAVSPQALAAVEWMLRIYEWGHEAHPGHVLERATHRIAFHECDDPDIGCGRWRPPAGSPKLIDIAGFDPQQPWVLSPHGSTVDRVLLSEHAELSAALAKVQPRKPLTLPAGIAIDEAMRVAMRLGLKNAELGLTPLPPDPFGSVPSEFVQWLSESDEDGGPPIGRYWRALHGLRPDLRSHFPEPGQASYSSFAAWTEAAWRVDHAPVAIAPIRRPSPIPSTSSITGGINVVGYLSRAFSLGTVARGLIGASRSAGLGVSLIDCLGSASPTEDNAPKIDNELRYDTTLTVVNPEQYSVMRNFLGGHVLEPSRRRIGYWFWELDQPSRFATASIGLVDEIWVGSTFNRDGFQTITDRPVRLIPVALTPPNPSTRDRQSFGLPTDRTIFLCTFDLMSIVERKNPFGVIEAFSHAFADGEGPILLIKTTGGSRRWASLERIKVAAAGRGDIVVYDEYLNLPDQHALIGLADCLVSLHRSEGLGLHFAEAMAMGVPVIATNYSGNVDFMDPSCAAMIDYTLVPVTNGEGVYSETARWAQPDIEQAGEWMRRLASDPELRATLGEAGRQRIAAWPSEREIGTMIAQALAQGR